VGLRDITFSEPELDDLTTRAGVFESVSPIGGGSANLTGVKQPERIEFVLISFDYFSMLGATPQIGRLYGPQDYVLGFSPNVVISDALWHRDFGADPNVLGRTFRFDGDPATIVGVLPPGFRHPGPTGSGDVQVWAAAGFSADPFPKAIRSNRTLNAGTIGRLKPGLTLAEAQSRLTAMAADLRKDFPTDYPPQAQWTIEIQPLQEVLVGTVRPMLLVTLGAVILIVFIVSAEVPATAIGLAACGTS
jgi:putative ABC transport system permease protein